MRHASVWVVEKDPSGEGSYIVMAVFGNEAAAMKYVAEKMDDPNRLCDWRYRELGVWRY